MSTIATFHAINTLLFWIYSCVTIKMNAFPCNFECSITNTGLMLSTCLFAGDGKTHYIIEMLKGIPQSHQVIIAINEAFTYMTAIEKLCSLPSDEIGCAVFFNFTLLPPVVSL